MIKDRLTVTMLNLLVLEHFRILTKLTETKLDMNDLRKNPLINLKRIVEEAKNYGVF